MAGGNFVGLDIGSQQMKVVETRKDGSGVAVTALGVAPTPQEAFENSVIVDAQLLGKAVKDLLKTAGVTARECVSSVSGQSAVVVRVIDVPQMKPTELAETMKWEVERHVPFAVNEVIMDYQLIERPEGYAEGQNMDVLLAVAQQDMIDRHVEMLFAAGLKPKAIDVEPLAAGRSLLELDPNIPPAPGHTVAIVNMGASNTDIGIFRDKLPAFPRTLPLAGDNLTRAIADGMQVDMATAEQYKRELGEVLFGQAQQSVPDFGGGFGATTGFMDFTTPPPPQPEPPVSSPTSSPSGRMPFDFSTPSETAPPAPTPSPFELGAEPVPPAPGPFGAGGGTPSPTPESSPFDFMQEGQQPPPPDTGFMAPDLGNTPPPPSNNLPVLTTGGNDPQREALKTNVFNCMAPVLAEMVQELRRSLDYYRGKASDAVIHEIWLTGGTAKLRNLAPFLEAELGIPTRVADPMHNVRVVAKNFSAEYLEENGTLFPISIGLGAYRMSPSDGGKKRK
jgi:type IV pilus assembly protein PilM